jgi:UDP-glucuronate decarboxylase
MLGLAKRLKIPIFQASTSEVYGDPEVHPQPESYWGNVNPIGYRSCYDEGKRCAESLFFAYHRQHDLPVKVGRIFNTYGPRMHPNDGRVISNFIMQSIQGKPITIYGDGKQTRSFCYVNDIVELIIKFMNKEKKFCGPLNMGNPEEYSILDVMREIIDLTGSGPNIIFKSLLNDDPKHRQPDISNAKSIYSWEPR